MYHLVKLETDVVWRRGVGEWCIGRVCARPQSPCARIEPDDPHPHQRELQQSQISLKLLLDFLSTAKHFKCLCLFLTEKLEYGSYLLPHDFTKITSVYNSRWYRWPGIWAENVTTNLVSSRFLSVTKKVYISGLVNTQTSLKKSTKRLFSLY